MRETDAIDQELIEAQHHCHAVGCFSYCPPEKLMCRRHWAMLPRGHKLAVIDAYQPGQCDTKNPSRAWLYAARAAIRNIACQEKKDLSGV